MFFLLLSAKKAQYCYKLFIITYLHNIYETRLVISEASRNTRYRMGSVVKTAVRNLLTDYRLTDSVQTGSLDTFLSRFALSYGMTVGGGSGH